MSSKAPIYRKDCDPALSHEPSEGESQTILPSPPMFIEKAAGWDLASAESRYNNSRLMSEFTILSKEIWSIGSRARFSMVGQFRWEGN